VLYRGDLRLVCNLGDTDATVTLDRDHTEVLLSWGSPVSAGIQVHLGPESCTLVAVQAR
jgi:hypothetical protein